MGITSLIKISFGKSGPREPLSTEPGVNAGEEVGRKGPFGCEGSRGYNGTCDPIILRSSKGLHHQANQSVVQI